MNEKRISTQECRVRAKWCAVIKKKSLLAIASIVYAGLLATITAAPRLPLPPLPEGRLATFGWDASFSLSWAQAQAINEETAVRLESWSGYSLLRDSQTSAEPVAIPVFDGSGSTNLVVGQGAIRFWLSPNWSTGEGPGHYARLIELDNLSGNTTEVRWSLYLSADGATIYFSGLGPNGATDFFTAPVQFNAGEWRMLTLGYSPTNSALWIDDQPVASGSGPVSPSATAGASCVLVVGTDIDAQNSAESQFEDLATFRQSPCADGPTCAAEDLYFNTASSFAWMGPVGTREEEQAKMELRNAIALDNEVFAMDDVGGMSTMDSSYSSTNLWLEITGVSNGWSYLILHGTTPEVNYEILTKESLTNSSWFSEGFVLGAEDLDWTPIVVPVGARTNALFFLARSWVDSDGGGLPDWWQLQYFGSLGTDPYADPDGDGWNNLQEYQNGTDPTHFNTPPPPRSVTARIDSTGTNVILSWQSGGGPVTAYTIARDYGSIGQTAPSTVTFSDAPLPDSLTNFFNFNPPFYQIRADFPNGSWSISAPVTPFRAALTPDVGLARGPSGKMYLVLGPAAQDFSGVRVTWVPYNLQSSGENLHAFDVTGTNFSSVIAIPDDVADQNGGLYMYVQGMSTNGALGAPVPALANNSEYAEWPTHYNFVDARPHLKENLKFMLRSATITGAFSYTSKFRLEPGLSISSGFTNSPSSFYARPPCDSSYNYYGFRVFDNYRQFSPIREMQPIQENFLWRNLVYDPVNFSSFGVLTNGVMYDPFWQNLRWLTNAPYQFLGWATNMPAPVAFTTTNSTWLYGLYAEWSRLSGFDSTIADVGLQVDSSGLPYLPTGVRNLYGLALNSVHFHVSGLTNDFTYLPGGAHLPNSRYYTAAGHYYLNADVPSLQTVDYYFSSQLRYILSGDPPYPTTPGSTGFTVTNQTALLLASVGEQTTIAGWAKQAIVNGYSDKYAYLEQYFDKAYKIGTSGVATTNETGVLSPYGDFLPLEPGPTALVTMPDIDTGQRGTGIVNVIKLQLDVNHDGMMDLSFTGPDNTSASHPFRFWINNDYDRLTWDQDDSTYYEDSVEKGGSPLTPGKATPDCDYRGTTGNRTIPSRRDLQDFTRLWVSGITTNLLAALPANSTISLSWGDVGSPNPSNPTIDLFKAAEADGGIGYLTNSGTAVAQTFASSYPHIGRLGPGQSIQLNASQFNGWAGNYFVWCGVSNGSGGLTLTIADGSGNTLAQNGASIQIADIKQMYERWTIGDNPKIAPKTNAVPAAEDLPPFATPFQYGPSDSADTPYILFVHGWNVTRWNKDRWAECAFKRLYWQGYQGRFGFFRWPTDYDFQQRLTDAILQPHNFDDSEFTAWRSAAGLLNKLADLDAKYPGRVYLFAHSLGNVVVGEALRLAGNNQLVNTYVASQSAMSAHLYDASVTNRLLFIYNHPLIPDAFEPAGFNYGPETPNIYGNRLVGNSAAVSRRINFYNAKDFALAQSRWGYNQIHKPDTLFNGEYAYNGSTNDAAPWNHFEFNSGGPPSALDIVNNLQQRYEAMAYAAESYSTALGATAGITTITRNVDLARPVNPIWPADTTGHNYADHFWHSAQFRGDSTQEWQYWQTLLHSEQEGFGIQNQ